MLFVGEPWMAAVVVVVPEHPAAAATTTRLGALSSHASGGRGGLYRLVARLLLQSEVVFMMDAKASDEHRVDDGRNDYRSGRRGCSECEDACGRHLMGPCGSSPRMVQDKVGTHDRSGPCPVGLVCSLQRDEWFRGRTSRNVV